MDVNGKVALITGGAQGLGKGFAIKLLDKGAKVLMTDINEEVGTKTREELQRKYGVNNVDFIRADVTSEKDMEESFQKAKGIFSRLDIVVNNAGVGGESNDSWEKTVDINFKAAIRCTRMALNYLRTDKGGNGGVIINISSAGGWCVSILTSHSRDPTSIGPFTGGCFPVDTSKPTRNPYTPANPEFMDNGVRVNVLCPAFVDTPLVANLSQGTSANTSIAMKAVQQHGLMSVEEVAEFFYELVTDVNNNGAVMYVNKNDGKKYLSL